MMDMLANLKWYHGSIFVMQLMNYEKIIVRSMANLTKLSYDSRLLYNTNKVNHPGLDKHEANLTAQM